MSRDYYGTKAENRKLNILIGVAGCVLVLLVVLIGWMFLKKPSDDNTELAAKSTAPFGTEAVAGISKPGVTDPAPTEAPDDRIPGQSFSLLMGGDMLFHSRLINAGLQNDGSYNFNFTLKYVKDLLAQADVTLLDMEGTLNGEPYSGYPIFSAPDAVADAFAYGGADIAITSNNHMIDHGTAGAMRTKQVLEDAGLTVLGTRNDGEDGWLMRDINGIKVGFTAWVEETMRLDGGATRAINGIPVPQEMFSRLDSYTFEEPYIYDDLERIKQRVADMRAAGAEVVIFCMHGGVEYAHDPTQSQQFFAQKLCDYGVDLILGAGPHVVEPIVTLKAEDSDHRTLCYYSVGNCVSNQMFDTENNMGFAEDGIFAGVVFTRNEDKTVSISKAGYIPFYCYKTLLADTVLPASAKLIDYSLDNPNDTEIVGREDELRASNERTESIMANNAVEQIDFGRWYWLPQE